ncbi:MAG: preprotein translocase subunit SecG [Phycisphaerae bacterium]|nr:preprotein translocase subunit SecG [Phycisphaerae bacterium]
MPTNIPGRLTLILVVLLQVGKGQSIGAAFGGAGSSQTFFGSRGPATFLSRLTTISATVFMLTSLTLAYVSFRGERSSSITERAPAPVTDIAPGAPPAPVTTPGPAPAAESLPTPVVPTPPAEAPQQGQ